MKSTFLLALKKEIRMYAAAKQLKENIFHSVYFGGGTPSEFSPAQLGDILDTVRTGFHLAKDAEITLEGVAGQMARGTYLRQCAEKGFNRITFGSQSFDPEVRKSIGRPDTVDDIFELVGKIRSDAPAMKINTEIMVGLPGQSPQSVQRDIDALLTLNPDSIDILYYIIMPGTRLHDKIKLNKVPQPKYGSQLLNIRSQVNQRLQSEGYEMHTGEVFVRNEPDYFVKSSFGGGSRCMNTILALGPSAFGIIGGTQYRNVSDLGKYLSSLEQSLFPLESKEHISPGMARRRQLMFHILRLLPIPFGLIKTSLERQAVKKWLRSGLVRPEQGSFRFTEKGKIWYNNMQADMLSVREKIGLFKALGTPQYMNRVLSGKDIVHDTIEYEIRNALIGIHFRVFKLLAYRSIIWFQLVFFPGRNRQALTFTGQPVDN